MFPFPSFPRDKGNLLGDREYFNKMESARQKGIGQLYVRCTGDSIMGQPTHTLQHRFKDAGCYAPGQVLPLLRCVPVSRIDPANLIPYLPAITVWHPRPRLPALNYPSVDKCNSSSCIVR
ncbi:hypothetical protein J6590_020586 [Homalodisca vitripennis]|nr:hypothetical protein J6590_020586 [Homalodisca vitripennis]